MMTKLRSVAPRAAANLALGRLTLRSSTSLFMCVIAAPPTLADSSRWFVATPSPRNFSTSPIGPSEALSVLKDFVSRLEGPIPHRTSFSRGGEAVRRSTLQGLANSFASEYTKLPLLSKQNQQRAAVLTLLARECGSSETAVESAVTHYHQHSRDADQGQLLANLRHACTPRYDRLFHLLLEDNAKEGMQFLVSLRQDLLTLMQSAKDEQLVYFKELDNHMKNLLSAWFGPGMLDIRRITYECTAASIIEAIATKEAVHPMRSLEDLRTRLGHDHRVFCAFHPLLPDEPLVFCHVALRPNVSCSMEDVLETSLETDIRAAVFYSISSTQAGLSGVDLGQFLLKQAISLLQNEFPALETFVTLSPIPRFRKWIQEKVTLNKGGSFVDDTFLTQEDSALLMKCFKCTEATVLEAFSRELEDPSKMMGHYAIDLEPLLVKWAARYLVLEKHHGKPLDGVARFHVRNGADMYQLNYQADTSRKGWHSSLGIMINYRYHLPTIDKNQLQYELDFNIPICEGVSKWLPVR